VTAIGSRNNEIRIIIAGDKMAALRVDFQCWAVCIDRHRMLSFFNIHQVQPVYKGVALSPCSLNQLESYGEAIHLDDQDVIVSWHALSRHGPFACWLSQFLKNPLVLMSPFDWVKAPYRMFRQYQISRNSFLVAQFRFNFCAHKVR
jgi:hypothetical protein